MDCFRKLDTNNRLYNVLKIWSKIMFRLNFLHCLLTFHQYVSHPVAQFRWWSSETLNVTYRPPAAWPMICNEVHQNFPLELKKRTGIFFFKSQFWLGKSLTKVKKMHTRLYKSGWGKTMVTSKLLKSPSFQPALQMSFRLKSSICLLSEPLFSPKCFRKL